MTTVSAAPDVASWHEPAGILARGTVVVVPGRGEHPGVYERFGRRIAADGYRVWAVADPTTDEARAAEQIRALLREPPSTDDAAAGPEPRVLVGSDTGALFAAGLVAEGEQAIAALVLAGLPVRNVQTTGLSWDDELAARTACPTHQGRLGSDAAFRPGALTDPVPAAWFDRGRPVAVGVPVLGIHGADDQVSALDAVRSWYAAAPRAELVSVAGGKHDALNDQTHRTAAATVVLFLERLRAGADALARVEALR